MSVPRKPLPWLQMYTIHQHIIIWKCILDLSVTYWYNIRKKPEWLVYINNFSMSFCV